MIEIEKADMLGHDNAALLTLSTGKKYKILMRDYDDLDKSELDLDELRFLSRKYSVYNAALSKIAFSDMSKKQLYQKLYQKFAFPSGTAKESQPAAISQMPREELRELCAAVCDEFEAAGYINDEKYALEKAEYLRESKKYGPGRIKEYLYQKGAAKSAIDAAIAGVFADDDEDGDADGNGAGKNENINAENMQALLSRKFRAGIDKTDRKDVAKAINYLSRNGYSYAQAKTAVTKFTEEDDE